MCGRFVLVSDLSKVTDTFRIQSVHHSCPPNRSISPGQNIAAVVRRDDQNHLVSFLWGLIPSWAKDASVGQRMFNARAETVAEKPSFRSACKRRRCLIVADGFYEWQKQGRHRQPCLFRLRSEEPFGFAGLYDTWVSPDGSPIHSCTIITTTPNDLVRPIHDRMPVILPRERESTWIDPSHQAWAGLFPLLKPYPSQLMRMTVVSKRDMP